MNLIDAYVTEVLSEPKYIDKYANEGLTWWQVKVQYDSYGVLGEQILTFNTEEDANKVTVGYHFLT